jgi:hypothetical protein
MEHSNCQREFEARCTKDAQVRSLPASFENTFRNQTESPVLCDQCKLEFIVISFTRHGHIHICLQNGPEQSGARRTAFRIENPPHLLNVAGRGHPVPSQPIRT